MTSSRFVIPDLTRNPALNHVDSHLRGNYKVEIGRMTVIDHITTINNMKHTRTKAGRAI